MDFSIWNYFKKIPYHKKTEGIIFEFKGIAARINIGKFGIKIFLDTTDDRLYNSIIVETSYLKAPIMNE